MAYDPENKPDITISSRTLPDPQREDANDDREGLEAYCRYQPGSIPKPIYDSYSGVKVFFRS